MVCDAIRHDQQVDERSSAPSDKPLQAAPDPRDVEACKTVMDRSRLTSKRDAVDFALRMVAAEALGLDDARALRGSG